MFIFKKQKPYKFLLDADHMLKFFSQRKKDISKKIDKINKIEIYPVKKRLRSKNFHLVVIYEIFYTQKDTGKTKQQKIVCSSAAHHSRKKYYRILKLTYENFKHEKDFGVPRPLWYINSLQAMFYKGVKGGHLLTRIIYKKEIDKSVKQLAHFLAKFHQLKPKKLLRLDKNGIDLKILNPTNLLDRIPAEKKKYKKRVLAIFNRMDNHKKDLDQFEFKLAHCDMHLENIIFNDYYQKTNIIDFSEACLAPVANDLGSFVQQLQFQTRKYISNQKYLTLKNLFLTEYFEHSNYTEQEEKDIKKLIILYQAWTALKSVVWYLGFKKNKIQVLELLLGQAENFLDEYEK